MFEANYEDAAEQDLNVWLSLMLELSFTILEKPPQLGQGVNAWGVPKLLIGLALFACIW